MLGSAACLAVLCWAAALSVIDIRERRLPNVLTLTGAMTILGGCAACGRGLPAILGAAALGGLYLSVHLVDPAGLGGGDVKLALGLGALTGAFGLPVWLLSAIAAPMLTAILGVTALLRGRGAAARPAAVPHGPSMCAASLGAVALALF